MKIIRRILICVILVVAILALVFFYKLSSIQIRDTKDYSQIYVHGIFDYEMMINPTEEYSALYQIDLSMRKEVAEYMKKNNYKLKSGKQEFVRIHPTIDELINDGFVFEKMSE